MDVLDSMWPNEFEFKAGINQGCVGFYVAK